MRIVGCKFSSMHFFSLNVFWFLKSKGEKKEDEEVCSLNDKENFLIVKLEKL